MRSPIVAMLWENWRLTRVEAAQRLGLGLVAGGGALALMDNGATTAFGVLVFLHAMIWFSIAKLNGGRFMDGYKPGFPFYLLYTRPVPTVAFVGVTMAYDAISCVALYLASAAALGLAFGQPLPLVSVTLWLVAAHFAYACVQWSTSSRVVQWVGSIAFGVPLFFLLRDRLSPTLQVEFSLVDNALLALLGIVSYGLTVAGVARQRRGDAVAASTQLKQRSGGYADWLVTLFRFPCPTSTATRAQVWFELKSSGLPALAIGLSVAILIFLLFAIGISIEPVRFVALPAAILSVPVVLLQLGGNAFGIRRKQGHFYASSFDITQACGTAHLAGLKVLVRTVCVLAALLAIGTSVWASSSFLSAWGTWVVEGNDAIPGLLKLRRMLGDTVGGLSGFRLVALAVVLSLAVAGAIAWQAAREALKVRDRRRVLLVEWLPIAWGVALIALTLAQRVGIASALPRDAIIRTTFWIAALALLVGTIYLFWSGFARRAMTIGHLGVAVLITATFAAAGLTFGGAQVAEMPAKAFVGILIPTLLLLMTSVAVPWSLSRIRHL